jgi:lipoprotein-releasing system permease protein
VFGEPALPPEARIEKPNGHFDSSPSRVKPAGQGVDWRTVCWIAWRNFSARRQGGGLSFMTTVSIFGVAVGVAALVIVLSVMAGFGHDIKRKMLKGQPHLEILSEHATGGFALKDFPPEKFEEVFPEASGVEPFTTADVVMKRRNGLAAATLFGIDPDRGGALWGFGGDVFSRGGMESLKSPHAIINEDFSTGEMRAPILLGAQLATQLGADIGDEISVISPQFQVGAVLGGGTLSRSYVVAGTFETGMFNYDAKWAVVDLSEGRHFLPDYDDSLGVDQFVTGVAVNFPDPMSVEQFKARIKSSNTFKGLQTLTWQQTNKSLLFALKLEKFAMGAVLMLIVVVAAFSISGTMMTTLVHKRSQIALMRALGLSQVNVAQLFLAHGAAIGIVGIVLGLTVGLAVCLIILWGRFIPLPEGVYHLQRLPVQLLPFDYLVICALAWLLSIAASVGPALAAARQQPSQGLRYE